MKRMIVIAISIMAALGTAFAQNQPVKAEFDGNWKVSGTILSDEEEEVSKNLLPFSRKLAKNLPFPQAYQAEDLTVLKSANAWGSGLEAFVGGSWFMDGEYFTPEIGLGFRLDEELGSLRVTTSVLSRQYNAEAISAGKKYLSYTADVAGHINLLKSGYRTHILNVFVSAGYMFGKHNYKVGEAEVEEGTILTSVRHNGSGITFGGGLEYRAQFFATGNAMTIRVGYKNVPNTYVNNTKHNGMVYAQVGFNLGIKRSRVRPSDNK